MRTWSRARRHDVNVGGAAKAKDVLRSHGQRREPSERFWPPRVCTDSVRTIDRALKIAKGRENKAGLVAPGSAGGKTAAILGTNPIEEPQLVQTGFERLALLG